MTLEGRSIGVFNVAGEFFALRNACPHQGGPLCQGVLSGFAVPGRPGEYRYVRRGEILRCPWHGWEFDVRTGQSYVDPARTWVRTYPVELMPGPGSPRNRGAPPSWLRRGYPGVRISWGGGPYQAETYQVTVEGDLVVVYLPVASATRTPG